MTIIFGQLSNSLGGFQFGRVTPQQLQDDISQKTLYFVYLAIAMFVLTVGYMMTWIRTSENASHRLRKAYLRGVLRQDIAYFDKEGGGSVSTRIITDTQLVQDGIGEKVPLLFMNFATFVSAFAIGNVLIDFLKK